MAEIWEYWCNRRAYRCLGSLHSTIELHPHLLDFIYLFIPNPFKAMGICTNLVQNITQKGIHLAATSFYQRNDREGRRQILALLSYMNHKLNEAQVATI
jgi:hypothetical protein